MIAFDLKCSNGHTFEGWFEDGKAFEEQKKNGLLSCPACNDMYVDKILSPVAIKKSFPPAESSSDPQDDLTRISKRIVEFVVKNFEDVGTEFTKEALKIHYGVGEPRSIRGVSTQEEEKTLKEEGIQFFKIPLPTTPETDS